MTDSPRSTTAETATLLLCGARLTDGRTVDVRLSGPRIEAVGTAGSLAVSADRPDRSGERAADRPERGDRTDRIDRPDRTDRGARIDLRGYLLLPAPAEPHAHLDFALTAGGPPSGDTEDVQRRATEAALLQLGHGATAVRSHVGIGDVRGLRSLEAVLQARQSLRGLLDVQVVAVPRLLTGAAGADGLAMLRDALKMGAAAVGGCPDLDPDPSGYTEAVLSLAAEFGLPVDLHTSAEDPARMARLAAMAGGLRPGVTLGPCHGLPALGPDAVARTADRLAAAGVSVVALPQGGCGALDHCAPAPGTAAARAAASLRPLVPLTAVRTLRSAGVRVTAGSGALCDLANPVGRGDPLEAAYLLASHGECAPPQAYGLISAEARAVLGLPEVRVEAGFPAELLAVRGESLAGVLSLAYSRIVIHRGRVVSRTSAVREYCDSAGDAALDLPRQAHRQA
ncbi:cytosine deaminase [Actinacidiphila yanglinensis]|uniref:Cytosine deaminase n=1 Tax=Actinacidiphila yanglinensis TaxID=310779 RepID=A0A1H6BTU7_9ACTN|nr:amidohydrolase family protein [Actinacidiphila yanglinensis]SEG64128.1 cytosine deaminase [Actinacidiphila yanglinensis]